MGDTIQSFNERAISLRAQGRAAEAVAAFSEGIVRFPNAAVLYHNLAATLDEMGAPKEALLAYDSALARAPHFVASLVGKANLLLRDRRIDDARACLQDALATEPHSVAANLAMYELLQIAGDPQTALEHQRRALARQRLYSHVAPSERRSVLVLCMPGDWQANVPVDFLFDRTATSVHKLYVSDEPAQRIDAAFPPHDIVFNAIAESSAAIPYLRAARRAIDASGKPSINAPERVLGVGRLELERTLRDVPGVRVAAAAPVTRERLRAGDLPCGYPAVVRPVDSHAGHGLARIETAGELESYLAANDAHDFFVGAFVDYASGDGFYRKYRIAFVDGEPYPVHLAISPNWMIHYYNAPMSENAWMRAEEERFLSNLGETFGGDLRRALQSIAQAVGLEYFGIDCTIDRDGRLFVFEADSAMLVHTTDPEATFAYKHRYVPAIYRAIERMIDRRKAADT